MSVSTPLPISTESPEEKFGPMVMGMAIRYWAKLPPSVRCWIDAEDLAQECLLHVRRKVLPSFDGRASLSTYLHHSVENYLRNLCEFYTMQKRFASRTFSVDQYRPSPDTPHLYETFEEDTYFVAPASAHLAYVEAANGLRFLYASASMELQGELRRMFTAGKKSVPKKFAPEPSQELRLLADRVGLKREDFRLLLHSGYVIA